MKKLELYNVYYSENNTVKGYLEIFLETNKGILKNNITRFDPIAVIDFSTMNRFDGLDVMKEKYSHLYIEEVRKTYDNNIYMLISNKFLLSIEYVLNSNFDHSIQEIGLIDDIHYVHKSDFEIFNDLENVTLPVMSNL